MINDIREDLDPFSAKRLKRLHQNCKIWHEVTKIHGEEHLG